MKKINIKMVLYIIILVVIGKSIFNIIFYAEDNTKGFVFGFKPLIVGSDTMDPSIKYGSVVVVKKASKDNLKDGDVIAYKVDDNIIIHRAYIEKNEIKTKADIKKKYDIYTIKDEDLLGYVVLRINTPLFKPLIDKINSDFDEIDEDTNIVLNTSIQKRILL